MSVPSITAVFARIGLMSFGGPAAQIALMHRELVERRSWLTEEEFLRALSFCMLLPGPEAMQLATYAGWKLGGIRGGLVAGLLFVFPGAAVIGLLAWTYLAVGDLPAIQALFLGVQAAVLAIVVEAILRVARRALRGPADWALAVLAFLALYVVALPFPLVVGTAALWGGLTARVEGGPAPPGAAAGRPLGATGLAVGIGLVLWALPLAGLWIAGQEFLLSVGLFFSKLAVVSFGGAYAVLAYMAQEVVTGRGWLTPDQMIDALGLAETTPGPLILVTQFVGHLAGAQAGGLGLAAGLLVLWVTFVPCFLWIFAGAPWLDRLTGQPRLKGALAAITAAVTGVIANLSLWFALHVLFRRVSAGPPALPDLTSLDPVAALLALGAGYLLLRRHWPLPAVLVTAALGGVAAAALAGRL